MTHSAGVLRSRRLSRRALLMGGLASAGLLWAPGPRVAAAALSGVHPRSDWGANHPPLAAMDEERPEDVRFLLLHHSATPNNDYQPGQVRDRLRAYYNWHTRPDHPEGPWPDIAYNFLVDRFGGVWEGRAGSLAGPVKGDATGGSQGFALLCCFIGDHATEPPTEVAITAMVGLCAALALRYGIDPSPGARTSFVSRGSNRWPAGAEVETATIAGHRDMSQTTCPGDAGYEVVTQQIPALVAQAIGLIEEAASEPDPGSGDDPGPEPEPTSEPDAEPDAGPDAGEEPEPGPESSPEPSPEPEPDRGLQREPHHDLDRSVPSQWDDSVASAAEPAAPEGTVSVGSAEPGMRRAQRRRAGVDGLGIRELTVLGIAAAAAGAGFVARSRQQR